MKRSGYADLPLHYGRVPQWLAQRMSTLGGAIIEYIITDFGTAEVLRRMSDPFWFQALGCVMGMDWHSSGITTSVMGALKKAVNPRSKEFGLFICGGRGKHSRNTPNELLEVADKTGLDGEYLVRCSKLSAKVDNNAVQDGFQIYLHSFLVDQHGRWTVVQQGLNDNSGLARRYHWHSPDIKSFVEEPHSFIYGQNRGQILNMTDREAANARERVLTIATGNPGKMMPEIRKLIMPDHHDVRKEDVNLKRLGAVLALAYDTRPPDFESLLLTKGLGPRTLQSLALVSEVIYGTPVRFRDPARFSFAHGGKDGHPAPVLLKVYDETIQFITNALNRSSLGLTDKKSAFKKLSTLARRIENTEEPFALFDKVIEKERREAKYYGGRTVFDKSANPDKNRKKSTGDEQLTLF
ncbi:MAG: DUF763 domain-containing protein [Spirochaetes bacterium]|nr:DUF763 domain-containing protein [Spirochaetota bacterium]